MATKATPQTGLDEHVVDDPEIENALEHRQSLKERAGAAQRLAGDADETAKALLGKITIELPEGGAVRIGRFRITRAVIAARSVSFDSKERSQVRIGLVKE